MNTYTNVANYKRKVQTAKARNSVEMSQDEVELILKPVIANENIINANVHILGGSQKGDGYLGIVKAVEVRGENKTLKLILKTAPKNAELRNQIEHGDVKPFIGIARCFVTSKVEMEEALALENLKELGFDVYDRKKTMDKHHVAIVLEEYGRFHALSYALRERTNELFREMTQDMDDILQLLMERSSFEDMLLGLVDKARNFPEIRGQEKVINALDCYGNTYSQFLESLSSKNADQYAVILHGDCWCNNMMFKYEDNNNPNVPTSMRLIDWQLQRLGSPVLDLSYYLYACAGKEIFNDLDECLKIYHNSLSVQLTKLGSNPDTLLSFDVLKDQWRKFGKYGMNLALFVMRFMLSDSDAAPDLMAAAEDGQSVIETFDFECSQEEEYRRRVTDVILHCYENKFI